VRCPVGWLRDAPHPDLGATRSSSGSPKWECEVHCCSATLQLELDCPWSGEGWLCWCLTCCAWVAQSMHVPVVFGERGWFWRWQELHQPLSTPPLPLATK
jgi:hypothetical protein